MSRQLVGAVLTVVAWFLAPLAAAQAAPLHGRTLASRLSGVHAGGSGLEVFVAVVVALAVVVVAYAIVIDHRHVAHDDDADDARAPRDEARLRWGTSRHLSAK